MKRRTDAEALAVACPKCGAPAGRRCHDYRGLGKAACPARKDPNHKSLRPPARKGGAGPSLFGD